MGEYVKCGRSGTLVLLSRRAPDIERRGFVEVETKL